jgi:hypothetical protein
MLSETYGIMVYQEQVMQTAQILGGYSLGGADLLRRAMGKKKLEEMAEHREIFRKGAAKHGIEQDKADEIFDLMEKFAGYGFNKSHAAAYSLLAYHTGWLKVHYTAEFFCANMTVEMDDTDKLKLLFEDAQKNFGITFEPPDVNRGNYRFEPVTDRVIRYGLGAVKGTGQLAVEAVVRAREEGGPFKSLFDFCVRIDRQRINKRTVEALIKAGAFDAIQQNRAALLASVDRAFDFASATAANASQVDIFGDCEHGSATQEPELVDATPWGVKERLTLEKTAVGFYLSGHLFDEVSHEVRRFCKREIGDLIDSARPAGDRRHRERLPRDQRPARAARDLQARRQVRGHRRHGRRGADQRQPQHAEGRRARDRQRPAAARARRLRGALPGAAGVGPGHGALPLRQVPARGRERQGARHRAVGERLPAAHRADRSRRPGAGPAGAPVNGARWRAGRAATGRARQVLPDRCRACELDGAGRSRQGFGRLRMRG